MISQRATPTLDDAPLLTLRHNEYSGYGVFAMEDVKSGLQVLDSGCPALYVVYRAFRKEVCGYCFKYENGRNWKVRLDENGGGGGGAIVFCSEDCRSAWVQEYKEEGKEAYVALESFVQKHARKESEEEEKDRPIPSVQDVEERWNKVVLQGDLIRSFRTKTPLRGDSNGDDKQSKSSGKAVKKAYSSAISTPIIDIDMLFFLLSGVLSAASTSWSSKWQAILSLNPSPVYNTFSLLEETTTSYLHLMASLPISLLPLVTRETMEVIIFRDIANSFGIWSSEEDDGGEMLGHGTWPNASFFNHSCSPTVTQNRVGRNWVFKTLKDCIPGTEMCISYIRDKEKELGVVQRRELLKNGWGFVCRCSLCLKEE